MYKCSACATPFSWWTASFATAVSPHRCPRCDLQQHRALPLLLFLGMYLVALAATALAIVLAVQVAGPEAPAWIFLPFGLTLMAWEVYLYRRGEMRPTTRGLRLVATVLTVAAFAGIIAMMAAWAFWGPSP